MFWISSEPSARGEEFHYDLGAVRPFETRASPIRLCRKRSFATHGRGRRGLPHLGEKLIWPAASSGSRPREKTFLMAEALARRRARRDLDCPPRRTFVIIAAHCQERNPR